MANREFEIAEQFALHTKRHFFLTGKAGTGKTTLLKTVAEKTSKNFVVVAPTGVAAINAGGVTLHSMFSLPLTAFVPSTDYVDPNLANNRRSLAEHLRYRKEKLRVIQEMELLIMDEVSMVRCDILDAVDFAMRTVRKNPAPFGGVQVMLIGDMHQLPPVVKDNEWQVLRKYYTGPYFFHSLVWSELQALNIELRKIYRQSDEKFLSLLNNIRHQQMDVEDYELLEKRFLPTFEPTEEGYILLSTHNRTADSVNEQELKKLDSRSHLFEAVLTGDFPENMYPCEKVMHLKEGAQVMFIRNDSTEGKYFNGKLARVKKIDGGKITVTFSDNEQDYELHRETWENINYTIEDGSERIKKNELGTFSQYPLRLAWAITIHKSQGLTFDKVIIDAGQSFAAGQVYVALSRCRTLQGIVLHSQITPRSLHSDPRIVDFSASHHSIRELESTLAEAKAEYANYSLKRLFTFAKLSGRLSEWREMIIAKDIPEKEKALELHSTIFRSVDQLNDTARKFQQQLDRLLQAYDADAEQIHVLRERCEKAIDYFAESIFTQLITPLHEHITSLAYKSQVKTYVRQVQMLEENFWNKIYQLYHAFFLDEKLHHGDIKYTKDLLKTVASSVTSGKKEKGGTYRDTLALHRQGKSIEEIAELRGLALSTIKGHFAKWILSGDIDVYRVLPAEVIHPIKAFFADSEEKSVTAVLRHFGEKYDGGDVRMVVNALMREKTN